VITIKDVAKLAEVNISTVSKVFNNYGGISDATKERIFKAAKELGYIPSKSAAELSRGVQPYLGLIINNLNTNSAKDEYIFRIVSGVQERSSELEMDLTLFTTTQIKKKDYSYVDFNNVDLKKFEVLEIELIDGEYIGHQFDSIPVRMLADPRSPSR